MKKILIKIVLVLLIIIPSLVLSNENNCNEFLDANLPSYLEINDKKSNEYYGHSNANCQMDMKKSVFLEPTEKNFQLKPRAPNNSECRVSLSQKIYNHERALACLDRLDF